MADNEIKILITARDDASTTMRKVAGSADDMDKKVRGAGGGFGMLGSAAAAGMAVVATAAAAGVAAVGAFVASSVSAAGNFEASVNGLSAVAGSALADAGFSLDDVSAKALQLGKDTQFSAQEAILAMTELAKGGVPIQSVMTDATDATLALAAAAGVDLPNAAEIVAKQLGVWAETGVTAAEVTDLLASAANASTVDVEGLALGLAQAGGTAKTAGVEFDEMVQAMALIAPNFSSASDAGTSFKTFLSRLIPTTNPAKDAMYELGLYTEETGSAFYDAQGQFIGMEAAAGLLQSATAGLTEEQRLLAFQTIFGADAIRAAAAIANAGAEGYNAMGASMAASGGAAAAAAAKQQGFAFAMEQFSGSVETAQIILGSAFLPMLTQLIGYFTEGVNQAANLIEKFRNIPEAIAASDDPIRTFLASLAVMFPEIGKVVHQVIAWYDSSKPLIEQLQVQIPAAIAVAAGFWNAVLLPALQAVWSFITTVAIPKLTELAMWLSVNLPPAIQALSTFWQTVLLPALQAVWGFITETAIPKLVELYDWIATNLPPVIQALSDTWNDVLLPVLQELWGFISESLLPLFQEVAGFIAEQLQPGVEDLKQAFSMFAGFLSDSAKPTLDAILAVLTNFPGPIQELISQVGNAKGMFSGWRDIIDKVTGAFRALADVIRNLPTPPDWARGTGPVGGAGAAAGAAAARAVGVGRAMGGAVYAGRAYTVGERGPEPFFPAVNGRILSVGQAQAALAGGGTTIEAGAIVVHGAPGQSPDQIANAAIKKLNDRTGERR